MEFNNSYHTLTITRPNNLGLNLIETYPVCNLRAIIAGGACDWKELNSIESYDPRESKWETFAYLKVARQDHGACVINDRMFVIGG